MPSHLISASKDTLERPILLDIWPTSCSASHESLTAEPCETLEVEQGDAGDQGPAVNVVASRLPQVGADKMAQRHEKTSTAYKIF